jgi:hypothetical protein
MRSALIAKLTPPARWRLMSVGLPRRWKVLSTILGRFLLGPIFARIRNDSRHRDLKVLQQTKATQRLFPIWSMAYADTPDHHGRRLAHFAFESALTDGALPDAHQMLDTLCRTVMAGSKAAQA